MSSKNLLLTGPCVDSHTNLLVCDYNLTTKQVTNCTPNTDVNLLCWDNYVPGTMSFFSTGGGISGVSTLPVPNATSASGIFTDPKLTQEVANAKLFNSNFTADYSGPCINGQTEYTRCVYPMNGSTTPICASEALPCPTAQYKNQNTTIFANGYFSSDQYSYIGSVPNL